MHCSGCQEEFQKSVRPLNVAYHQLPTFGLPCGGGPHQMPHCLVPTLMRLIFWGEILNNQQYFLFQIEDRLLMLPKISLASWVGNTRYIKWILSLNTSPKNVLLFIPKAELLIHIKADPYQKLNSKQVGQQHLEGGSLLFRLGINNKLSNRHSVQCTHYCACGTHLNLELDNE